MGHVGAAQTDGPGVFHHQQALAERPARRARELLHWRDHHQLRRTALALGQPGPLALGELRRHPVRAVRPLDLGIARLGEPQRPPVACPRYIHRLAGLQAPRPCPCSKAAHRGRDLPQARDHGPLEIFHPALPPLINPRRLQPAHADQHVDRGHELPLSECRFRRPQHTPFQRGPIPAFHDPARPAASHRRRRPLASRRDPLLPRGRLR